MTKVTKNSCSFPCILHKLSRHACRPTIHRISRDIFLFSLIFSTHQIHYVKIQLWLERCRHPHCIRYEHLGQKTIKHHLQDRRPFSIVTGKFISKKGKRKLSNPAVFQFIRIARRGCSGNLVILLHSELTERQNFTSEEQTYFHCKRPPQNHDFHTLYDSYRDCNDRYCSPL